MQLLKHRAVQSWLSSCLFLVAPSFVCDIRLHSGLCETDTHIHLTARETEAYKACPGSHFFEALQFVTLAVKSELKGKVKKKKDQEHSDNP